MTALAKRAVACAGFRWMAGMMTVGRSLCVSEEGPMFIESWRGSDVFKLRDGFGLPDLDDPATLGCILALVREAWAPSAWVMPDCPEMERVADVGSNWVVRGLGSGALSDCLYESEAEALVAALEAAP